MGHAAPFTLCLLLLQTNRTYKRSGGGRNHGFQTGYLLLDELFFFLGKEINLTLNLARLWRRDTKQLLVTRIWRAAQHRGHSPAPRRSAADTQPRAGAPSGLGAPPAAAPGTRGPCGARGEERGGAGRQAPARTCLEPSAVMLLIRLPSREPADGRPGPGPAGCCGPSRAGSALSVRSTTSLMAPRAARKPGPGPPPRHARLGARFRARSRQGALRREGRGGRGRRRAGTALGGKGSRRAGLAAAGPEGRPRPFPVRGARRSEIRSNWPRFLSQPNGGALAGAVVGGVFLLAAGRRS